MANPRRNYQSLLKRLKEIAQRTGTKSAPKQLIVALDPVNCEKLDMHALESISTVMQWRDSLYSQSER